jgi:hypothetical protein
MGIKDDLKKMLAGPLSHSLTSEITGKTYRGYLDITYQDALRSESSDYKRSRVFFTTNSDAEDIPLESICSAEGRRLKLVHRGSSAEGMTRLELITWDPVGDPQPSEGGNNGGDRWD